MPKKNSAVKKLISIHDTLNEKPPNNNQAKKQVIELANELDAYGGFFGEPECDSGETIPGT